MATQSDDNDNLDKSYDKDFDPTARAKELADAEQSGSTDSSEGDNRESEFTDPTDTVREQEEASDANWSNNYSGQQKSKGGRFNLKKSGVPMLIVSFLLSMAAIVSFFGGPGLLIVHITEIMTEKFNYQQASMSIRTRKILESKVNNSTTGVCSKVVTIRCKFASFSDKEIENFRKAGIDMKIDENMRKSFGRTKITSMEFEGKAIPPSKFITEMTANPTFGAAVRRGFNPKYAAFSAADSAWSLVKGRLRLSERAPFSADMTDEERTKTIDEKTRNGDLDPARTAVDDPNCNADCQKQRAANNAALDGIDDLADDTTDGTKASTAVLESIQSGGNWTTLLNGLKVTGIADDACMALGMYKAVAIGAKTIRVMQMAGFAMIIFKVGNMIKAGDATAGDAAFIGSMLTSIYSFQNGTKSKSATDSFGYRYAAHGDRGIDDNATQYLAGGGLGGKMSGALNTIYSAIPGGKTGANATCKFLNNTYVQITSLVVGIVLWLIPGGQAISGAKLAGQAALAIAMFAAQAYLPALLADLVAGRLIDESSIGESAGNIMTGGAGGMLSQAAIAGANPPMTVPQAKEYALAMEQEKREYAALDRLEYSPFDATNPNTFMGSIYGQLAPSIVQIQSGGVSGGLAVMGDIFGSTFSNMIPKTSAAGTEEYDECQDMDYEDLGLATDPFCNLVPGMDPKLLQDDPVVIADRLIAKDLIDPVSGLPKGEYGTFYSNCIAREIPFGTTSEDFQTSDGRECILDDSNSVALVANDTSNLLAASDEEQTKRDMYVHAMNMRINHTMENGYDAPPAQTAPPEAPATSGGDITSAGWTMPIKGASLGYRWHQQAPKGLHKAQDFMAPIGTPIYAAHDGVITMNQYMGACGYVYVIKATNTPYWMVYQHVTTPLKEGTAVTAGQQIGKVGQFCGSGHHLHFGIETANRYSVYADSGSSDTSINPMPLITGN